MYSKPNFYFIKHPKSCLFLDWLLLTIAHPNTPVTNVNFNPINQAPKPSLIRPAFTEAAKDVNNIFEPQITCLFRYASKMIGYKMMTAESGYNFLNNNSEQCSFAKSSPYKAIQGKLMSPYSNRKQSSSDRIKPQGIKPLEIDETE